MRSNLLLLTVLAVLAACGNPEAELGGEGGGGGGPGGSGQGGDGQGGDGQGGSGPACTADADCPAPAMVGCVGLCVDGTCDSYCDAGCTTDADCPQVPGAPHCAASCQAGACEVACQAECAVDADCPPDSLCDGGYCVPACVPVDCALFCEHGFAQDENGCFTCACLPGCVMDADCPDGSLCVAGECLPDCPPLCDLACPFGNRHDANGCELCVCNECGTNLDCPQPGAANCAALCVDSSCQLSCEGCTSSDQCLIGELCEAGACAACACPDLFAPVCGADGVTYGNACDAECHHVAIVGDGACDAPACRSDGDCAMGERCLDGACVPGGECVCPAVFAPVCGVDGVTYGNACEAGCVNVAIAHEGECGGMGACGSNADCGNGEVCMAGVCGPPCEISCLIPDPVCGTDGRDYACGAADTACHGVGVAYEGACRPCNADVDCFPNEGCFAGTCLP